MINRPVVAPEFDLTAYLQNHRQRVDRFLAKAVGTGSHAADITEAMT